MSWAVARWRRAARLSTSLVNIIFQQTRSGELHLDEHVNWHRHAPRPPCGSTSTFPHTCTTVTTALWILMSWAVSRWHRAARLSTSLVRVNSQQTHPAVLHLDDHVECTASIGSGRTDEGATAKPALLGPISSDWAEASAHALEAEPYSSNQVREGAPRAESYYENRVTCAQAACARAARSDVMKRPWDASPRLHTATCTFERWTGRIEHRAGALRKSIADTFDRISRDDGVEGHECV